MTILTVEGICCGYGTAVVVSGFDMSVPDGGLVCLLGPSGCGKTTVLRAIAGFSVIAAGTIRLRGEVVSSATFTLSPERRGVGMVFQDYALFPHLSVGANVGFGLPGRPNKETVKAVAELLEVVGLSGYAGRYPHELSGGEQQRVALARALAPRPDLVLLDEPFSNLDIDLRERLSTDVAEILKRRRTAAILVTHDQHEAFALGELVGVMREGNVMQWDTPYNLYHKPSTRFVADFIGQGVFIRGSLISEESVETDLGTLRGRRAVDCPIGAAVDVLLRPDDIVADENGPISGMVVQKAFKGAEIMYSLVLPTGQTVLSLLPSHMDLAVGEHVRIRVAADHLVAFPVETDG